MAIDALCRSGGLVDPLTERQPRAGALFAVVDCGREVLGAFFDIHGDCPAMNKERVAKIADALRLVFVFIKSSDTFATTL